MKNTASVYMCIDNVIMNSCNRFPATAGNSEYCENDVQWYGCVYRETRVLDSDGNAMNGNWNDDNGSNLDWNNRDNRNPDNGPRVEVLHKNHPTMRRVVLFVYMKSNRLSFLIFQLIVRQ
jgi:hypothetical protein